MSEARVSVPDDVHVGHREFVDADGTLWRQRGERDRELTLGRLHDLLLDQSVAVLLAYVGRPEPIVGDQRAMLWQEMEPVLTGVADYGPNDRTDFGGYEYRTLDRQRKLLIIYKSC